MTVNRIHTIDEVMVEIYFDGKKVDTYQGSGFHTVDEAIRNAASSPNVWHGFPMRARTCLTVPCFRPLRRMERR